MDMYECNSNSTCKPLSFSDVSFKLEGEIISGSDGVRVKLSQAKLKHARSWFSCFLVVLFGNLEVRFVEVPKIQDLQKPSKIQ